MYSSCLYFCPERIFLEYELCVLVAAALVAAVGDAGPVYLGHHATVLTIHYCLEFLVGQIEDSSIKLSFNILKLAFVSQLFL